MRLYQLLKNADTTKWSVWCANCNRFRPVYTVLADLDGPSFVYRCAGGCDAK